ncbi:MAG: dipeptidase PepE [Planctomycetes bacterium]|nr:dipeptidase PepE [Planctomycetota bacterium]
MFDRFSDHAKKTMSMARRAAIAHGHGAIAPEHLLLGMLDAPACSGVAILTRAGIDDFALRFALDQVLVRGPGTALSQLPFTPEAKRVLEFTMEGAQIAGHSFIGSQHVLFGIVREGTSVGAQVLASFGLGVDAVRTALVASVPNDDLSKVSALLVSNSTMHGGTYLGHCAAEIRDILGARKKVLFVPYALHDHDAYFDKARAAFAAMGHDLISTHLHKHAPAVVDEVDAVFVGGGNTFRLLSALYHYQLLQAIQRRALSGMPYIGSSAGTNVATLSIRTTNDMPIVQPPTFTALQLVPFQINPHYLDPDPSSTHMGETREERIRQFHEEHSVPVLGLREGCMLRVTGERIELRGTTRARLFRRGETPEEFTPPCDLSFLSKTTR